MNKHTAQLLEKHFDTAFAAPDGIKKLRELILTLAMQGKLVPQDPSEQPAKELLKEVEAEKQRLVKEGKIKKPKPLSPVMKEEKPYTLPHGWGGLDSVLSVMYSTAIASMPKKSNRNMLGRMDCPISPLKMLATGSICCVTAMESTYPLAKTNSGSPTKARC